LLKNVTFAQLFEIFPECFPTFFKFCLNDKSKLLGVRFHLELLHHYHMSESSGQLLAALKTQVLFVPDTPPDFTPKKL